MSSKLGEHIIDDSGWSECRYTVVLSTTSACCCYTLFDKPYGKNASSSQEFLSFSKNLKELVHGWRVLRHAWSFG